MDFMAAHAREGQWLPLFDKFVLGLVSWLLCATNINEFFLFLTRRYCRASWGGPLPDFFLKLALLLVLLLSTLVPSWDLPFDLRKGSESGRSPTRLPPAPCC